MIIYGGKCVVYNWFSYKLNWKFWFV
jgi:hypothetical protein